MSYLAIARKYRPQSFDQVIGQEPIVQTLKNAIEMNLVAHAYIFSGMRGVGKTTTARVLAKALNCVKGPTVEPCGDCPPCQEIAAGTALDVLEIDAASNRGIDEIRELRETVRYLPARDRNKVFIIDEAHMLTTEAFNALLKTLEEPPPRVLFVLATTEPHRIPTTIHSRCQSFHFRSISFQEILGVLESVAQGEKVKVEREALAVITRAAEGSLRDALSILDQAVAYSGSSGRKRESSITADGVRELLGVVSGEALTSLVDAIAEQSSEKILRLVDELVRDGHNLQHFCREALRHVRNLLMVRIGGAAAELAEAAGEEREVLERAARRFSEEDLLRFFNVLLRTEGELRWSPQPRLHLELGLLKLVQAGRLIPLEEVLSGLANNPGIGTVPAGGSGSKAKTGAALGARTQATAPTPRSDTRTGTAPEHARARSAPASPPAVPAAPSVAADTVEAIKTAVYGHSKFLGSFVDHVTRWERSQEGLNLWFSPENRTLIEMLSRQQQGDLERIVSQVLDEPIKVNPRVGTPASSPTPGRTPPPTASAPANPVVQALLDRFGGQLRPASATPRRQSGDPSRRTPNPERQD